MDLEKSGFRVLEELYHSLHTTIFRAFSIKDQKQVVLKLLRSEHASADVIARFHQEYKLQRCAGINSSRVVQVYDLVQLDNAWIMVMEDAHGSNLSKILHQITDSKEILDLALKILEAVSDVHQAGIIHFDLCPQNLLVNEKTFEVKLVDFGQAVRAPLVYQGKRLSADRFQSLPYLAPEQTGWLASPFADFRSDYYSLGIILYQLITGELPDNADSWREGISFKLANKRVKPNLLEIAVPQQVWELIDHLCEVYPEKRPQSLDEIRLRLNSCFSGQQSTTANDAILESLAPDLSAYRDDGYTSNIINRNWRAFVQGELRGIGVYGRPKTGKSLLTRSLAQNLLESGGLWLDELCQPGLRSSPFKLFRSLLCQIADYYCQQNPRHSSSLSERLRIEIGERLAMLFGLAPELRIWLTELSHIEQQSDIEWDVFELGRVLAQFLDLIAQHESRIVIHVDQANWIDQASLSFMIDFMQGTYSKNVLILFNWEQSADPLATDPNLNALRLIGQRFAFINLKASPHESTKSTSSQLYLANPLQLSQLERTHQTVLSKASLLGMIFHYSDLLHLMSASERPKLIDDLGYLSRQGFLIPVENICIPKLWSQDLSPELMSSNEAGQVFMFLSQSFHKEVLSSFVCQENGNQVVAVVQQLAPFYKSSGSEEVQFFVAELIKSINIKCFHDKNGNRFDEIIFSCANRAFELRDFPAAVAYLEKNWSSIDTVDHKRKIYLGSMLGISLAKMGRIEEAELIHESVRTHLTDPHDQAQLLYVRACLADHLGQWEEGIGHIIFALTLLGQTISPPGLWRNIAFGLRPKRYFRQKFRKAMLLDMPSDRAPLISNKLDYDLRIRLLSMAQKAKKLDLVKAIIYDELAAKETHSGLFGSPFFAVSFAAWAHSSGSRERWIFELAEHAAEKAEAGSNSVYAARTKLTFGVFVGHCWQDWRHLAKQMDQIISMASDGNDQELLGEALHFKLVLEPIERIDISLENFNRQLIASKSPNSTYPIRLCLQKLRALSGQTKSLATFEDEEFPESKLLDEAGDPNAGYYHIHKAELLYMAQQFETAMQHIRLVEQSFFHLKSTPYEIWFYLIRGLIVAELVSRSRIDSRIAANILRGDLRKLRQASKLNDWYSCFYYLLKAEACKRPSDSELHFEAALQESKKSHSNYTIGLIYERFAWCLLRNKKISMARIVFQDALYHYEQMGAHAKVRFLREELALKGLIDLPSLQGHVRSQQSTSQRRMATWNQASRAKSDGLRFHHILEYASKISRHDRADAMIRYLLEEILTVSNSEKVLMLHKQVGKEDWLVDACIQGKQILEFSAGSIIEFGEQFSRRIFDYAKQTGRAVHYSRSDKDPVFANDPYVVTFDVRAVLCVPYCAADGSWFGMYLEKTLSDDRYPPELVDTSRALMALVRLFQTDEKRQLSGPRNHNEDKGRDTEHTRLKKSA